jgi:hypothetical protein
MQVCNDLGWKYCLGKESSVRGRFGNKEEFLYYQK